MSKYDKDTKFYWLQLKEDFFDNDAIEWLEEQKPNGKEYAYFYLKLCLKAVKSNGVLIRKVGDMLLPYDNKKLAEITKMDFDTITVAMELLKKIGLVKILENGEIYINQLENMIGSKSIGAFKKQQQRLLSGQVADICPPKIEIDKEIDKEIELDIKKDLNVDNRISEITKYYEENIGMITPAAAELLFSYLNDFLDHQIIIEAIKKASISGVPNANYINGILKNWKAKGFKVLADLQSEQKRQLKEPEKEETEQEAIARKTMKLEESLRNDRW